MIPDWLLLEVVDFMGLSFPLQPPLVLKPYMDRVIDDWGQFQVYLKVVGYINQNGLCLCNEALVDNGELHHALISRKDAMKISLPNYIHCSYNVLVLHHACHKRATREKCYERLLTIFPQKDIEDWYYQAPFKSTMRKL